MVPENAFRINFKTDVKLDPFEAYQFVQSTKCGAINLFSGTIRDWDIGYGQDQAIKTNVPIKSIHYEAYESMARRQITQIICNVLGESADDGSFRLIDENSKAFVDIRLGEVPVGEASIIICVSSTNRQLSHSATITILSEIKANVAIWKKIVYIDGYQKWDHEEKSEAHWMRYGI